MQTPFDERQNNFDMIRLLLAILVLFSHSYALGIGSDAGDPVNLLTRHQANGGAIAVDLFFIISGFLITASYERSQTVRSYLRKRVARIYPAFILGTAVCLFVVLPLAGGHLQGSTSATRTLNVLTQTLRLQEPVYLHAFAANPYPDAVNGSTWSIQFEFWCYIGVVVLGLAGVLRSRRLLMLLFLASIAVGSLWSIYNWRLSGGVLGRIFGYPPFWARLLPMYLAGVVFYRFRHDLSMKPKVIALGAALLATGAFLPHGWPVAFPIAGTYLMLVLAFHPAIRCHHWSRFGDFSYGTYLYAFPIQQLVMHAIGHRVPAWELFALSLPPTLLAAVLSWHLVEKHFLKRAAGAASGASKGKAISALPLRSQPGAPEAASSV